MRASRTLRIMSGMESRLGQVAPPGGGGGGRGGGGAGVASSLLISPVQQTAFLTCFWRREESLKPAPLVRDPFAARLVDAFVAEETLAEMRAYQRKAGRQREDFYYLPLMLGGSHRDGEVPSQK